MGYYADVNGYLVFRNPLPEDRMKSVLSMLMDVGWYKALASKDRQTINFWSADKYYYQTGELLNAIALDFPVYSGRVECAGEDGDHWLFRFVPGPNHGTFEEHAGSVVYDDEYPLQSKDAPEFIRQIIEEFDLFLDYTEVSIPNDDPREPDDPGTGNIYGSDYENLAAAIDLVLRRWHIYQNV